MPGIKVSTSCVIYISLVMVLICFPITSGASGPCRDLVVGRHFEKAIAECTAGINAGNLSNYRIVGYATPGGGLHIRERAIRAKQ